MKSYIVAIFVICIATAAFLAEKWVAYHWGAELLLNEHGRVAVSSGSRVYHRDEVAVVLHGSSFVQWLARDYDSYIYVFENANNPVGIVDGVISACSKFGKTCYENAFGKGGRYVVYKGGLQDILPLANDDGGIHMYIASESANVLVEYHGDVRGYSFSCRLLNYISETIWKQGSLPELACQ